MSLLAALKHYHEKTSDPHHEIEYRLVSWGEIYPPFISDREHSDSARVIFNDFPFKLFSVSTPYSELPQKLALTFQAPEQKRDYEGTTHISTFADEIAKEYAALMALITRRRIFAIKQTRINGLPIEEELKIYQGTHHQERQRLREIDPDRINNLLKNLLAMDPELARGFMLAARLYHSAIEMLFTEPEFSYLYLVMSLEAISSMAYKDFKLEYEEIDQFLDSSYSDWRKLCNISDKQSKDAVVRMLLAKEHFTSRKFKRFVIDNLPDTFWTEAEDDAKPDYYESMIVPGPNGHGIEQVTRARKVISDLEKVDREKLNGTLNSIYQARSDLVHMGKPLPRSIVVGLYRGIPTEAFAAILNASLKKGQTGDQLSSLKLEIPPLLTFERMVSYSMVEFLRKYERP